MASFKVNFNSVAKRYNDVITFGGVDLSSPKFSIASNRAIDELNYIYRANSIQKRYGKNIDLPQFEGVSSTKFYFYSLEPTQANISTNATSPISSASSQLYEVARNAPVYNVWAFERFIVINKGGALFYTLISDVQNGVIKPLCPTNVADSVVVDDETVYPRYAYTVPSKRLSAFVGNDKLWILTGSIFLVISHNGNNLTIQPVQNIAYIPTTTIGITQAEASVGGNRLTFESANLLTNMRKNGIVGGAKNADSTIEYGTFTLDSNIDNNSASQLSVEINALNKPYAPMATSADTVLSDRRVFAYPYTDTYVSDLYIGYNEAHFNFSDLVIRLNDENHTKFKPKPLLNAPTPNLNYTVSDITNTLKPDLTDIDSYEDNYYYVALFNAVDGNRISPDEEYGWSHSLLLANTAIQSGVFYQPFYMVVYMRHNGQIICTARRVNLLNQNSEYTSVSTSDRYHLTDQNDYVGNIFTYGTYGTTNPIAWYKVLGANVRLQDLTLPARLYRGVDIRIDNSSIVGNIFTGNQYIAESNKFVLKPIYRDFGSNTTSVVYNNMLNQNSGLCKVGYPFGENYGWFLVLEDEVNYAKAYIYGYIKQDDDGTLSNQIVLFEYPSGSVMGDSNIVVTFPAQQSEDYKAYINNCTFGYLFGTSNSRNRLFVSGNANKPNVDWHSAESDEEGDFTYFPDDSFCAYGQDSNKVVGYSVISDGKLLVLKTSSDKEPSIYYRTATYSTLKDDYGNNITFQETTLLVESYPLVITNAKIGGRASYLVCNFNGDTLFVNTKGQIVGLDNDGSTYDNQRVASTRSYCIDKVITEINSPEDNCLLVEDGDELFYFTPSATYYSNYEAKYEWFKTDIKNVLSFCHCRYNNYDFTIMANFNGELLFEKTKAFADSKRYFARLGEMTMSQETLFENISSSYPVLSNEMYNLYTDGYKKMYTAYRTVFNVAYITASDLSTSMSVDEDNNIRLKLKVADIIPESTYTVHFYNSTYVEIYSNTTAFTQVDDETLSYADEDYIWVTVGNSNRQSDFHHCLITKQVSLQELDYEVDNHDRVVFTLNGQQMKYGINLSIQGNNDTVNDNITDYSKNYTYITKSYAVESYYITAPYLSSTLNYRKVIDSYAIVADTNEPNNIYVKVATNDLALSKVIGDSVGSQVNYSTYSLEAIDYRRYDLPHTQILGARFYGSFIAMKLYSPNATNSTLTQLQFKYHTAKQTYGKGA